MAKRMPTPEEIAWLREQLSDLEESFKLNQPSPWHIQVREGKSVVADWWPTKGTYQTKGGVGAGCFTPEEFLRVVQKAMILEA